MKGGRRILLGALLVQALVALLLGFRTASAQPFIGSTKVCTPPSGSPPLPAGTAFSCALSIVVNASFVSPGVAGLSPGDVVTVTLNAAAPQASVQVSEADAIIAQRPNVRLVSAVIGDLTGTSGCTLTAGGACGAPPDPSTTCSATIDSSATTEFSFAILIGGRGCAANTLIPVAESLRLVAPGGSGLSQFIRCTAGAGFCRFQVPPGVTGDPGTNVGATTSDGAPFVVPAAALIATSAAKVCAPTLPDTAPNPATQVRVGATLTCTVTVTFPTGGVAPTTATVTLTNATFAGGATTATLDCVIPSGSTSSCVVTEVINPTTACVTPSQIVAVGGQAFPLAVAASGGVAIQVLPRAGSGQVCTTPTSATKVCAPTLPDTVPNPAVQVRVGATLTCTVTVTFPNSSAAPTPATVTLTNATFAGGATTATLDCVVPSGSTSTCTVTEVINPVTPCVTPSQVVTVAGRTFSLAVVASGGAAIQVLPRAGSGQICTTVPGSGGGAGTAAGFRQPTGLVFQCGSSAGLATLFPTADPLGLSGFAGGLATAIGILPEAVTCTIRPTDADGNTSFAPGTIEVSSLTGALIDASGKPTTNLRVPCSGAFVSAGLLPAIITTGVIALGNAVNSCTGVQVSVAGFGVGVVELTARYEPNTVAAAAGITEVERTAQISFVAPVVGLTVLLSPNPLAVGQTGAVTARFNRTTLGCGIVVCINPATGLPLFLNQGTVLNGNVVFTIDNAAVAAFVGAQPTGSAPALTSTPGLVATANQRVVRCGFSAATIPLVPPSSLFPASSNLALFFGGCDAVSAALRGVGPGTANVSGTFVPDLPGVFGVAAPATLRSDPVLDLLLGGTRNAAQQNPSETRLLEVIGAPPSGGLQLARGCNNITPTLSEASASYANRVTPASAVTGIWEFQTARGMFRAFSPLPGAPNDLPAVTRLRPVFICVNAPASLDQPPA